MLRSPEEIIERLLARSKRQHSAPSQPTEASAPAAIGAHQHAVTRLFRRDPEITRKSEDRLTARRKAAMREARIHVKQQIQKGR
jgi:hypothetical protein